MEQLRFEFSTLPTDETKGHVNMGINFKNNQHDDNRTNDKMDMWSNQKWWKQAVIK